MADTAKIAEEISILMPVIARRILLEFFQSVDISQSQLLMIMAIYDGKQPCRLSELSQAMRISDPTASGLVDRLAKAKYVSRTQDPEDRRALNIELTKKGNDLAKKFRTSVQNKWKEILVEIPSKDQESFIRIMRDIRKIV